MSDIVERLRKWSVFGYGVEASADMKEAAAYIEIVVDDLNKFRNGEYFLTLNDHIRQQETEIRSMQDTIERLRAELAEAERQIELMYEDLAGDSI